DEQVSVTEQPAQPQPAGGGAQLLALGSVGCEVAELDEQGGEAVELPGQRAGAAPDAALDPLELAAGLPPAAHPAQMGGEVRAVGAGVGGQLLAQGQQLLVGGGGRRAALRTAAHLGARVVVLARQALPQRGG